MQSSSKPGNVPNKLMTIDHRVNRKTGDCEEKCSLI